MREWSIRVFIIGQDGEELPATCFDKVTYKLHESFGPRAKQGKKAVSDIPSQNETQLSFIRTNHLHRRLLQS